MTKTNTLHAIGTRIYYTGDMANQSGFGVVSAHRLSANWGDSLDITMDDGREIKALPMAMFSPGPGRRFYTFEEHQAQREAQIAQMKAEYEALMARRQGVR